LKWLLRNTSVPSPWRPQSVTGQHRAKDGWYAGPLTFEFYRFRFHFRSAGTLYFPVYKSGNIVRGAFGDIFRKLVCIPSCHDAKTCDIRASCLYARVFEPQAARGEGPSGLADWPRPFVFRAAHLDGRSISPGESFHFDVHIFDVRDPALTYFVLAFAQLAREGLGPGRGRADLTSVDQVDLNEATVAQVFDGEQFQMRELAAPNVVDLRKAPERVDRVRVRFVTPTELKAGHQLADRPEFGILFGRLRDRISTLRALYGAGPLEIDFHAMGERAAAVRMTRCDLQRTEVDRLSSRTGQRHPLGGFVGEAEYKGELSEFLPYLRQGKWTGVGRQTVWGKGQLEIR
jgi:CRISPR-associated endoribonuclease Cas6